MLMPKIEKSEIVFDEFLKIRKDYLINSDGKPYRYYILDVKNPAALLLAVTPDQRFVLIREYRHPTKKILLSLPGGYVDDGETPEEASKRELQEEAGYTAKNFKVLGCSYPYPGISSQPIYYTYAEEAVPFGKHDREVSEQIEVVLLTREEVYQNIKEGHAVDGNLLTALAWLQIFNKL